MPRRVSTKVVFRDKDGHFVKAEDRYVKGKVKTMEVMRRGKLVVVAEGGKFTPERIARVTTRQEFEALPDAFEPVKTFTSNKKYQAWDIAEKIDRTPGMRRKLLRVTLEVQVGTRTRRVHFYQKLRSNQRGNITLWRRINETLGFEGLYTYRDKPDGTRIPGRIGRKTTLKSVVVDEVK